MADHKTIIFDDEGLVGAPAHPVPFSRSDWGLVKHVLIQQNDRNSFTAYFLTNFSVNRSVFPVTVWRPTS